MAKKNKRVKDKRGPKEIVFDPDARKAYLQGFSDRKRQRRTYGLAMQKLKDRQAKVEDRAHRKQAMEEQIEEAEKQKEQALSGALSGILEHQEEEPAKKSKILSSEQEQQHEVKTFGDEATRSHWGGSVTVTTSTIFPDDEDDVSEPETKRKGRGVEKRVDTEQEYAGDVERFLKKVRGGMPGKKKNGHKHRGNHGAANMKGMANSGDMKLVQKALARSEANKRAGAKGGGKKRRR